MITGLLVYGVTRVRNPSEWEGGSSDELRVRVRATSDTQHFELVRYSRLTYRVSLAGEFKFKQTSNTSGPARLVRLILRVTSPCARRRASVPSRLRRRCKQESYTIGTLHILFLKPLSDNKKGQHQIPAVRITAVLLRLGIH